MSLLSMSDYKQLKVWQKAHTVALDSHKATQKIRGSEFASMRSQITRSAFSIPANIVEGSGVQTRKEYARFVRIALNSANELEYHLITARDLNLIPKSQTLSLITNLVEVRKMLHGLLKYLTSDKKGEM